MSFKKIAVLLLTGVLFTSFAGCAKKKTAPPKMPPVPVLVAKAVQKDIPIQINAIGTGEPDSKVEIKTQVSGQLLEVYFREGDFVRKGQLLFKIDPRPFESALKQSEANLARDTALWQNAEEQARRYAFLVEKDYVAKEQYDQLRAAADAQNALVQADKAQVENNRLLLEYTSITSPINGKTGSLMVHAGNIVKANDIVLVVIQRIQPIKVSFSIPEQQFSEVKKSSAGRTLPVQAIITGEEDKPENGTLDFLNNEIDNATATIRLKALFRNGRNRLWPGQFVNIVLTLGTRKHAVLVPSEAVQNGQNGQFLFVVKPDMTVESRQVTVGSAFGNSLVISNGLSAGETVVTDGQLRLSTGSGVAVKKAEEKAK